MAMVSPSFLSANFLNLQKDLDDFNASQAEWLHYDVMDGNFVPNISFGTEILRQIGTATEKFLDVHIMVSNPADVVDYFVEGKCRVDGLTFHYESCKDDEEVMAVIEKIKSKGWKAGLSIKPKTDVHVLDKFLDKLDIVLIMSVEPGYGGQKFMPDMMSKGDYLYEYKKQHNLNYFIEIDGGINAENGKTAVDHHFEVLVSGSYCFKHPEGFSAAVDVLESL